MYHGCASHQIWPTKLDLSYTGCRMQKYGEWSNQMVLWCFCDTPLCNVAIGQGQNVMKVTAQAQQSTVYKPNYYYATYNGNGQQSSYSYDSRLDDQPQQQASGYTYHRTYAYPAYVVKPLQYPAPQPALQPAPRPAPQPASQPAQPAPSRPRYVYQPQERFDFPELNGDGIDGRQGSLPNNFIMNDFPNVPAAIRRPSVIFVETVPNRTNSLPTKFNDFPAYSDKFNQAFPQYVFESTTAKPESKYPSYYGSLGKPPAIWPNYPLQYDIGKIYNLNGYPKPPNNGNSNPPEGREGNEQTPRPPPERVDDFPPPVVVPSAKPPPTPVPWTTTKQPVMTVPAVPTPASQHVSNLWDGGLTYFCYKFWNLLGGKYMDQYHHKKSK